MASIMAAKGERNPTQHSFDILEIIGAAEEPLGSSDIAERMRIHKSSVSRLLAALAERGYVERDTVSLRYRLGAGLIALAGAAFQGNPLSEIAGPILDEIARETRETVTLSVWNRGIAVDIAMAPGLEQIAYAPKPGMRNPPYCTATGKIFLATLDNKEREQVLSKPLQAFTRNTITSKRALLKSLDEVAKTGIAWNDEEFAENLCAVAVPVINSGERLAAALAISVPKFRFDVPKKDACVTALKKGAYAIAARLSVNKTKTDSTV